LNAAPDERGEVTVSRARAADLEVLLGLCAEHAAYERLPCQAEQRTDALAAALDDMPRRLHAWIARIGDQAVAYASATLDFSTLERAVYLHMDCLYVREGWRGRSIGLRLWETLRAFAHEHGCHTIQWQTPSWNMDAARFYRRLGAIESSKLRYRFPLEERD
jgi:GNAT superfamily N-acetyltransferase